MQAAWMKGCFSSALPGCTSIWADIIIQPQKDQQLLKQLQIFAKISIFAHLQRCECDKTEGPATPSAPLLGEVDIFHLAAQEPLVSTYQQGVIMDMISMTQSSMFSRACRLSEQRRAQHCWEHMPASGEGAHGLSATPPCSVLAAPTQTSFHTTAT